MARPGTCAAVLLAAGASRRFGGAKLLFPIEGVPLVVRIARAFVNASVSRTIAVLGARADQVRATLAGLPVMCVENPDWETLEMFSSVKTGLRAAGKASWTLISPADIQGLTAHTVSRFIRALPEPQGCTAIVPSTGARRGHPIALSPEAVSEVLALDDSARLDHIFHSEAFQIRYISGFGNEILTDLDRPEDLAKGTPDE